MLNKKYKIYCTKNDINYEYELASEKIIIKTSEHLKLILKSNKIDVKDFWNKVCEILRFKTISTFNNVYLSEIINDALNKMIKESNKTLEIE